MCRKLLEVTTAYSGSPSKGHHLLNLRSAGRMSKFLCVSISCLNSDCCHIFGWLIYVACGKFLEVTTGKADV